MPVSGKVTGDYNGRADTVTLAKSYLALPHTRVDVSGALGQRIQIRAVSRDLADFRPLAGDLPVKFNAGGAATVTATATGKLSAPPHAFMLARPKLPRTDVSAIGASPKPPCRALHKGEFSCRRSGCSFSCTSVMAFLILM